MTRLVAPVFSLWIGVTGCLFAEASPSTRPAEVIVQLEQTIGWYHDLVSVADSTATDVLQRDSVQQQALDAVRLGFDFARAEAALFANQPGAFNATATLGPRTAQNQNLQQAEAHAKDRVNAVQAQIQETGAALPKATARTR